MLTVRIGRSSILEEKLALCDMDGDNEKDIILNYMRDREGVYTKINLIDEFAKDLNLEDTNLIKQRVAGGLGFTLFSHDELSPEYMILDKIKEYFLRLKIYSAHRKPEPVRALDEDRSLMEEGRNLVGVMNTLQSRYPIRYAKLIEELKIIMPDIISVIAPPSGGSAVALMQESGLTPDIDVPNMSAGIVQLLINLFALETAGDNSPICIEEPELHLHASSQKKLFDYMTDNLAGNQLFITTHSPLFVRLHKMVSVYMISKENGIAKVLLVENIDDLKLIKKQLGIRNSDIFDHDWVLFIEGESEQKSLPHIVEAMGYEQLRDGRLTIVNLRGKDNLKKLRHFLHYLKDFETGVFLVVDGDEQLVHVLADLERERLLEVQCYKIWKKDFEDIFETRYIIQAITTLAKEQSFKFELNEAELESKRKEVKVFNILKEHLKQINGYDIVLSKPQLCERIASIVKYEILHGLTLNHKTNIEIQVEEIMDRLFKRPS